MLLKNFKKKLILMSVVGVCAVLCPPKPAMAANTDDAKKKVYNVQVTGQFLRKEALELLDLINEERAKVGEEPLVMDGEAVGVTDLRAVQATFVDAHVVPTENGTDGHIGKIFSQINTENGPIDPDEGAGRENLVFVSGSKNRTENIAEIMFESWMNSSGHKSAMLYTMGDRAGVSIYAQKDINGVYNYFGVLNSLYLSNPETALIPENCKYFAVPYTQGENTVKKTFNFRLRGDCIKMTKNQYCGAKVEEGKDNVKVGGKLQLIPLYETIHVMAQNLTCNMKFDNECGTWSTTTPDIVSVDQDGIVTGLKAGTGKVFFNLNGDSDKSSEYTIQVKATNIGIPNNVTVKKTKDNQVTISWKDQKSDVSYGYEIYCSKYSRNAYKLLKRVWGYKKVSATASVKPGQNYYYKVRAFIVGNGDDLVYGNFSDPVKYTCLVSQKKTPSLSAGAKKISIRWSKTGGADGTRICYYQKKGGRNVNIRYKNVAGSSVLSYTLAGLKCGTYYVKVRAYSLVDGKKVYGKYSSAKKIYVK